MKLDKKLFPLFFMMLLLAACNSNEASTKEQVEIKNMDSSAKVIETHTDKLEDQTKKVEESLEKLDKTFDSTAKK